MLSMKQEGQMDYIDENEAWKKIEEVMASLDTNFLKSFSLKGSKNKLNNYYIYNSKNNTAHRNNDINKYNKTNEKNNSKRYSIEISNAGYNVKSTTDNARGLESNPPSVQSWLVSINHAHLFTSFLSHGYDDINFMGPDLLKASNLKDMGITSSQQQNLILNSLKQYSSIRFSGEKGAYHHPEFFISVVDWLVWLKLPQYIDAFLSHKTTCISQLFSLTSSQLTSVYGITKAGHVNRTLASINFLRNIHHLNRNKRSSKSNNVKNSLTVHRNNDGNTNYNEHKKTDGSNKNNILNENDKRNSAEKCNMKKVLDDGNYSGSVIPEDERKGLEELLKECEVYAEDLIQASQHSKPHDVKPIVSECNEASTMCYSRDSAAGLCDNRSTVDQNKDQDVYDNLIKFSETPSKNKISLNAATKQTKSCKETSPPNAGNVYHSEHKIASVQSQQSKSTQDKPPQKYATTPRSNPQTHHKSSLSSLPLPSPTNPSPSHHPSTQPFVFPPQVSSSLHHQQHFKVFPALYLGSIKLESIENQELARKCIHQIRNEKSLRQRSCLLSVSISNIAFYQARSHELLGLHSVNSIFCVCQDEVDLEFFAFVTFDLLDNVHFCHVFKADDVDKSTEIVLAMAQAFDEAFAIIQKQDQTTINTTISMAQSNNQPTPQHHSKNGPTRNTSEQTPQKVPPKPARVKPHRPVFEETAILT